MVDANLQQPPGALHKNVCNRSGLPADTFELYYGSRRLDGEAVLANWGVEKDSLIEVKTRGRGGCMAAEAVEAAVTVLAAWKAAEAAWAAVLETGSALMASTLSSEAVAQSAAATVVLESWAAASEPAGTRRAGTQAKKGSGRRTPR